MSVLLNEKDLILTTLAIIGSGIAGRSLLYALARAKRPIEKITLFNSDKITFPCTLSSTAIVAPRGVTSGHSPLGDLLIEGFMEFSEHVELDRPEGVETITQYTGTTEKLEAFKARYPNGSIRKEFLKENSYLANDKAYLIDPETYTDWLLTESRIILGAKLEIIEDLVTEIDRSEHFHLKTHAGRNLAFDKVVMTAGAYNKFWKDLSQKSVQGSYLEFQNVDLKVPSLSLTYNGDNLIWSEKTRKLLIGSTTFETNHFLPPEKELKEIYQRIKEAVEFDLPEFEQGKIKVGLREKARKREPYIHEENNLIFLGGLYKNGFTLSLKLARDLSRRYL